MTKGKQAPDDDEELHEGEELAEWQRKLYLNVAARANDLAHGRPALRHAARTLCQRMRKPAQNGWETLKRVGRHLVSLPRVVQLFA